MFPPVLMASPSVKRTSGLKLLFFNNAPHVLPQGEDRILTRRSYRLGRSPHWVKVKNPVAAAVKRAAEEDRGH